MLKNQIITAAILGVVGISAIAIFNNQNSEEFSAQTASSKTLVYNNTTKQVLVNNANSALCLSGNSNTFAKGATMTVVACDTKDTKQSFALTSITPGTTANPTVTMKPSQWSSTMTSFMADYGKTDYSYYRHFVLLSIWLDKIVSIQTQFGVLNNPPYDTNPALLASKSDAELASNNILLATTFNNAKPIVRVTDPKSVVTGDIVIIKNTDGTNQWAIATGNHNSNNNVEVFAAGVPNTKMPTKLWVNYSSYIVGWRGKI
jgi:hypothetical protein